MNEDGLMIETADGAYVRKQRDEMLPTDRVVWGGGPDAFNDVENMQREFEAEVFQAGGIDAWRKQATQAQPVPA